MIRDITYYRDRLATWPELADRRTALVESIRVAVDFARDDAELAADVRAAVAAYEQLTAEPAL